jgi:hypothetical protein
LNEYTLDLGNSGSIAGERNEARITGSQGGTIRITAELNRPRAVNPGNIGVELSSEADLGSTIIIRGHVPLTGPGGESGIQRWFKITPETKTGAQASLRLFYLDTELAGKDKNALAVFSDQQGEDNWTLSGKDAADLAADWVLKSNLDPFRRFTLGISRSNALSKAGSGNAISTVQIYPNPAHTAFGLQISSERGGCGVANLYDLAGNLLEEKKVNWEAGLTTINWDISRFAPGVYYLSIGNQYNKTINIVKQ